MAKQNPTREKQRISARQAASAAAKYYREVVNPHADKPTLEEIEFDEASNRWMVTLGVYGEDVPFSTQRSYKRFDIDAQTGEVLAMRIRPV